MKTLLETTVLMMTLLFTVATSATGSGATTGQRSQVATRPGEVECKMSTDGSQVCGYNCMMGSHGHYACANTPNGKCAMGSDGWVTCSNLATAPGAAAVEPECKMSTDGSQVCGYNCMMGSHGRYACADTPNGKCAMGSRGRVTCSRLAR